MKVTFSINLNDSDGDSFDDCILIHLDDRTIIKLDDIEELGELINSLERVKNEIPDFQ